MAKNTAIECDVQSCEHKCCDSNYCSLDSIKVSTHEAHPTQCACTDCLSFKLKTK
ncbi:DUF1540 domain-containing protein [Anaerofustis sp.]|uniref:DUF1540 domain-containing protein n=1 Tax=Anaerofustis sp. TaxID=1872517 RepID=UPI0025C32608|nr:DUF1540 domain-containing protein [Anaerofustis sp.]